MFQPDQPQLVFFGFYTTYVIILAHIKWWLNSTNISDHRFLLFTIFSILRGVFFGSYLDQTEIQRRINFSFEKGKTPWTWQLTEEWRKQANNKNYQFFFDDWLVFWNKSWCIKGLFILGKRREMCSVRWLQLTSQIIDIFYVNLRTQNGR